VQQIDRWLCAGHVLMDGHDVQTILAQCLQHRDSGEALRLLPWIRSKRAASTLDSPLGAKRSPARLHDENSCPRRTFDDLLAGPLVSATTSAIAQGTQPPTDSSELIGAQRTDDHGRLAVRPCAIENSGERLHWLQCREMAAGAISRTYMLLIFGALIVLIAVVIIPRMRVPGSGNGSTLGWMGEQWLAEHRAAHSA
jgi:hypothetical protein